MNTNKNIIIPTDEPAAAVTANTKYDDDNDNGNDDNENDNGSSITDDNNISSGGVVIIDIGAGATVGTSPAGAATAGPATAGAFSTSTSTSSANSTSPTPTIPTSTSTSTPPILVVIDDNPPSLQLQQAVKKIHIQRGSNDEQKQQLDTNDVVVVEVVVVEESPPPVIAPITTITPSSFASASADSTSSVVPLGASAAAALSTSTSTSADATSPTPNIPTSTSADATSPPPNIPTSTSPPPPPTSSPPLLIIDNPPSLQAVKKIHIQRGNDRHRHGQQQQQKLVPISPGAAAAASTPTSTSPTPNIPTPTSTSTSTSPTPPSTLIPPPPSTSSPPILLIDHPPSLQAVKKTQIQRGNDGHVQQEQQQQQPKLVPIISLNECIYGRKRKRKKSTFGIGIGTKIQNSSDIDNENNDDDTEASNEATTTEDNTATTATTTASHSHHRRHDIDISILRKLCSTSRTSGVTTSSEILSGEEDENDPNDYLRGVIWRIVLGQLPTNDIYNTWSTTLTTQRNLYQELINTYLNCSNDNPTTFNSRSTFTSTGGNQNQNQTHQQQQQQQQQSTSTSIQTNQQEQEQELLDASLDLSSICPPTIQTTTEGNNDNDNDNEYWCNASRYQESMNIRLDEDIYNEFPDDSKYKELWKKSGITLSKGQSASSIGMNILKLPKELLVTTANDDAIQDDAIQDDANQDYDDELKSSKISTSTRNDKLFSQYTRDARTLMEIRKDVVRTHPTLQFYTEPKDNLGIRRHAAIERILFIWAKLNGNLYVQGMNEIVGTIYYVLANDKSKYPMNNNNSNSNNNTSSSDDYWSNYAECDTYYLFHKLMLVDDIRDVYHQDLDHESNPTGLHGRISNIELLIKKHDPVLYKHLIQNLNIDTSFYTIRWLTTLLSREFLLNDTIRLWDSMFSSTNKENFLRYFCATMVINIRSKLLCGDFGTCLKLLQNYPSKSGDGDSGDTLSSSISSIVDTLLESSRSLWIYESQIILACHKGGLSLNDALQMIKPPMNNNSNNGDRDSTIIMAYGLPGGIYDVSSTSTMIENTSNVTGQVLDVLSTTAAVTATVAATARSTAVVPMQKNVRRMFGKAKSIFNNRYNNTNTNNNNIYAAAATTTNSSSVDDDDNNNNDDDGTAATTTNTNATTITDDGWDIIDSIIGGNNEYLQHRRLIEDSTTATTTTTTTSIGLVGVGDDDDDRDCRRISQPSSPPSALEFKTTTAASTSITDIGIGGPALLTNAKNRLWNRISGAPTAAAAAAATTTNSSSSSTNDSTNTTSDNPINSKNDRFWNRRGGGSSGGR